MRVIGENCHSSICENNWLGRFHSLFVTKIYRYSSVEEIQDYAFCNCTSLESLVIPSLVTYIGPFAFKNCDSLKKISIPISYGEIDAILIPKQANIIF